MTRDVLEALWTGVGGAPDALARLDLTGEAPVLPSSYKVAEIAQASIAAAGLAAAELHRLRGGPAQRVAVDRRAAEIEFLSERYLRVDDGPPPDLWDKIAGTYRCGDGRWVRIHTNFPHHRDAALEILGCAHDKEAVRDAFGDWQAEAFETAAADRGAIASMMRKPEEWAVHPQGAAIAGLPLVTIERIGEAPARPRSVGERPLSGVRVLDFTRIIAGPVCGRTLASHGANVLLVTAPHLPSSEPLVIDTGRGKLSCSLDLRRADERARAEALLAEADVLVQGYRPGAIAGHGLTPERAAELRPGIVYVSLSAFGHAGPWQGKRGFDSIVQTASGINHGEATASGIEGPKPLPCQALDHASGYLLALGAMTALARQTTEGGSWHVRVALARTGHWLQSLGRVADGFRVEAPAQDAVADLLEASESGFGRLTAVRHAAQLSETPARWGRPSMPLGSHAPEWPARG